MPTGSSTRSPTNCAARSREMPRDHRLHQRRDARHHPGEGGRRGFRTPGADHLAVRPVRRHHPGHHHLGEPAEPHGRRLLCGWTLVHRHAERVRHRRRLHVGGLIALYGYDGFLYSIGFLVAWLVALLLVAELMRNTGKFTMADVLSFRMRQAPVRTAAAISTVVVSIFYLLAQMVGAGSLVALLLNLSPTNTAAKNWVIVLVGVLMIVYVVFGGMKGTTWVQIVKAVLLMLGALAMTIWVLAKYNFNISSLLGAAHDQYAAIDGNAAKDFIAPGNQYGKTGTTKLDFISLALALVLGTAGLPHVLIRFYTVPDSKTARKSVNWAIGLIGAFYLMTLVLGFGAAAIVGTLVIKTQNAAGNTAAPQLAGALGGSWMLAIISAVAFATILAVVAGLTLASSSSVAHDVYNNVIKKGKATDAQEVRVGRIAAVIIGAVAIALAIPAQKLNVAL